MHSSAQKSVCVLSNSSFVPLGILEEILKEQNFNITSLDATTADLEAIDILNFDLLIIQGGPQSPYETDKYPYLKQEMDMIHSRVINKRPVLGIALGAQLIAMSQGASIVSGRENGKGMQIRWDNVQIQDKLLNPYSTEDKVFIWQNDFYDIPKNAEPLASHEFCGHQGFKIGDNCLGLQFHAEVTLEIILNWLKILNDDLQEANINTENLVKETIANIDNFKRSSREVFLSWLNQISITL